MNVASLVRSSAVAVVAASLVGAASGAAQAAPVPVPAPAAIAATTPVAYAEKAIAGLNLGLYATGPKWTAEVAKIRAKAKTAKTIADLYPTINAAAKMAGGKHSELFRPQEAKELLHGDPVYPRVGFIAPSGITLVQLPGFTNIDPKRQTEYAGRVAGGIAVLRGKTTCGYIVDVRNNPGGDPLVMLAGLTNLLPNGEVMKLDNRDPQAETLDISVKDRSLYANGEEIFTNNDTAPKNTKPIVVVQNGNTASAAEVVDMAFKGMPNATSVGTPTAGYTTGNQSIMMPDGSLLVITTGLMQDRTGKKYGSAIAPDKYVAGDQAQNEAAINTLIAKCKA